MIQLLDFIRLLMNFFLIFSFQTILRSLIYSKYIQMFIRIETVGTITTLKLQSNKIKPIEHAIASRCNMEFTKSIHRY